MPFGQQPVRVLNFSVKRRLAGFNQCEEATDDWTRTRHPGPGLNQDLNGDCWEEAGRIER